MNRIRGGSNGGGGSRLRPNTVEGAIRLIEPVVGGVRRRKQLYEVEQLWQAAFAPKKKKTKKKTSGSGGGDGGGGGSSSKTKSNKNSDTRHVTGGSMHNGGDNNPSLPQVKRSSLMGGVGDFA